MKKINVIAWFIMVMAMAQLPAGIINARTNVMYSHESLIANIYDSNIYSGPTGIEVYPTPQTMKVGETKWVYAKQTGAIGGTYFYSEDTSIATVTLGDLAGEYSYTTAAQITGVKAGTVNIVAKNANGIFAICQVTVTAVPVTSVSILSELTMEVNDTYTIIPSTSPSNAETTYTWTSDKSSVASVTQTGRVTAKSAGVANIKVMTENGKSATCKVTVHAPQPIETHENGLLLADITSYTGKTVAFPICMTNEDEITALQMDLTLPIGITFATDEDGVVIIEPTARVSNAHSIDCNRMADGSYRIICFSTKNTIFTGNEGVLFNVILSVAPDAEATDYEITAKNIELSDRMGVAYTGQDVKGTVTVNSYMLGDVDNNGKHTINDAVCIINYILNQPNAEFVEVAADLDGNEKITINDAVLLISNYILGTTSNTRTEIRRVTPDNEMNYLAIDDILMQPGEVKTIEVNMINDCEGIKGLQCDITLPKGISFIFDKDAEEYVHASSRIPQKLSLSSEIQDDTTLRVAGVCTETSGIYGHSGSIFSFQIKADDDMMTGMYNVLLSNVELSYGEAINVSNRTSSLEIVQIPSGVDTMPSNNVSINDCYDMRGQKRIVSEAHNGIFIINGRKVLVE